MTIIRAADGIAFIDSAARSGPVFIRITIDELGQSLSLSDDRRVLIMAPLNDIKTAIKEAEQKRKEVKQHG